MERMDKIFDLRNAIRALDDEKDIDVLALVYDKETGAFSGTCMGELFTLFMLLTDPPLDDKIKPELKASILAFFNTTMTRLFADDDDLYQGFKGRVLAFRDCSEDMEE